MELGEKANEGLLTIGEIIEKHTSELDSAAALEAAQSVGKKRRLTRRTRKMLRRKQRKIHEDDTALKDIGDSNEADESPMETAGEDHIEQPTCDQMDEEPST